MATINIKTAPARAEIAKEAAAVTLTLHGSGGDRWETAGSGGSVSRQFSVTVTK